MKKWLLNFLAVICFSSLSANVSDELIGDWSGQLDVKGTKLTLVLHASKDEKGNLTATVDCLEQRLKGLAVDQISFDDGSLKFKISSLKAQFDGKIEKEAITGQFSQMGLSFPLTFHPYTLKPAQFARPQEPKAPFPYRTQEVSFKNPRANGVVLSGTLTLPKGRGPFPVVMLIAGSGPLERDEPACGHKPFLVLADHLTKQGIGVLRYDKRGVGQSTGTYGEATSEDFASDALAGVEFLKGRKDINVKKIGLIGHSEGGFVASLVAAASKDVAYIVMMGSPGVNGGDLVVEQAAAIMKIGGADDEQLSLSRKFNNEIFTVIKEEADKEKAEAKILSIYDLKNLPFDEQGKERILNSIREVNTPWFRHFLKINPPAVLEQVKVPVLALFGEKDLQVLPSQNRPPIEQVLAKSGHKNSSVVELANLNHFFQNCETGSPLEYSKIEETLAPQLLSKISDWVLSF